ncbi:MAG: CcmD family protein [Caldilineaceae bacterium]|nr:CcmD family protein [Caldilineaceae bacterium]
MEYLVAAFVGVWVLVLGYVVFLGQRQSHLEQELRVLEEVLSERKQSA